MKKLIQKPLFICKRIVLSLLHTKFQRGSLNTTALSHRFLGNKSQPLFIYCFTKEAKYVPYPS
ncbi:hypothetical protein FOLKNPGA_02524 [Legionella sp. PC1000]|nr:hypothetical protein FOLKNPGA_02524 [Legionella sp. PC1000]